MAEISYDCPHCGTQSAGFVGGGSAPRGLRSISNGRIVLYVCRLCRKGIIVEYSSTYTSLDPMDSQGDPRSDYHNVDDLYPRPTTISAPKHVPDDLAELYVEAVENLRSRRFTSAGMMFGKVLEIATIQLDSGTTRTNQRKRIAKLVSEGMMAPEMGELADIIRFDRNEAAHGEFTEESARQIYEFTDLFLTYVYTLPQRIKDAKAGQAQSSQQPC